MKLRWPNAHRNLHRDLDQIEARVERLATAANLFVKLQQEQDCATELDYDDGDYDEYDYDPADEAEEYFIEEEPG